MHITQTPTVTWFLATILNPLQGVFNFIIYMHPMVVHSKRQQPGTSWWQAIKYAFWSRGEDNRRDEPEQPVTRTSVSAQDVELGPIFYKEEMAERGVHPRQSFIALLQSPLYYEDDLFMLINDNTIRHISSYLDARDMVHLAMTCKWFGTKEQQYNNLSMMEESARQLFNGAQTEERQAVPNEDNYFLLYNELLALRSHLLFDQLVGNDIEYLNNDKSRVTTTVSKIDPNTAMSNYIMRAGKHYATFTIVKDGHLLFGVTRFMKGLDKKQLSTFTPFNGYCSEDDRGLGEIIRLDMISQSPQTGVHVCTYATNEGNCCWSSWYRRRNEDWEGNEASQVGDRIGLLLDLDEGTLSVYKNDRKLGVMKSGLVGKYCWFVEMSNGPCSVNIRREQVHSSY